MADNVCGGCKKDDATEPSSSESSTLSSEGKNGKEGGKNAKDGRKTDGSIDGSTESGYVKASKQAYILGKSGDGFMAELICSVCLNQYIQPKSLPCAHTFCEQCLKHEIAAAVKKHATAKDGFPCPVCKTLTALPKSAGPMIKWASQFPTNIALRNIIEKVARNCPYHKTQERTLFCFSCNKLLCTTCAWQNHKKCSTVLGIDAAAVKAKNIMRWYITELEEKSYTDIPSEELLQQKLKRLDDMNSESIQTIKNTAMNAREEITRCENDLLEHLRVKHTEKRHLLVALLSSREFVSRSKREIMAYIALQNDIEVLVKFKAFRYLCSSSRNHLKTTFAFDMDPGMFNFCSHSKSLVGACGEACRFE